MRERGRAVLQASALLALVLAGPAAAADAAHGRELFRACEACHNDTSGALGPPLKGVVGRKAAADPDFRYSPAMARSGLTWDEASLRAFLLDPQGVVKGTKMPFAGLPAAGDAEDVVAWLKTLK